MARPRLRTQILSAAKSLVQSQGSFAFTMRAVADAAGVTEASVFNNFGDKAGLVQALIRESMPQYQTLIQVIEEPEVQSLEVWFKELLAAAIAYFEMVLPLSSQNMGAGTKTQASPRAEGFYSPRRRLEQQLESLEQRGSVLLPGGADAAALMIMGAAMHSATTRLSLGQSDAQPELIGSKIAAFFLRPG